MPAAREEALEVWLRLGDGPGSVLLATSRGLQACDVSTRFGACVARAHVCALAPRRACLRADCSVAADALDAVAEAFPEGALLHMPDGWRAPAGFVELREGTARRARALWAPGARGSCALAPASARGADAWPS